MSNSKARRRGSVLVLVSLAIIALLGCAGLATDYAMLLADRNRLQRACDAGALAGASYLKRSGNAATDRSRASAQALSVARLNGLTSTEVTNSGLVFLDNDTKLKVSAQRQRALYFIRVLGIYNGTITASATAGLSPFFSPQVVPIGITPETRDAYAADQSAHDLTLTRPQDTDFYRTLSPTLTDPFVLTDLRTEGEDATHGSPAQMQNQLMGVEKVPIKIGDAPSSLRDSDNSQGAKFEEGIAEVFRQAARSPWNDPPAGVASPNAWTTVGTRWSDIVAGTSPLNNPRIVNLFVTNGVPRQTGNNNYPVIGFAPVYIESVTENNGVVTMRVHFLSPTSGYAAQPVGLID